MNTKNFKTKDCTGAVVVYRLADTQKKADKGLFKYFTLDYDVMTTIELSKMDTAEMLKYGQIWV